MQAVGDTIYDAGGRPLRMSGICIDITARQRAEEDLQRHREHLEELVAERGGNGSVHLTGDALAPGAIVHAVYQAHKTARLVGAGPDRPRRDAAFLHADV